MRIRRPGPWLIEQLKAHVLGGNRRCAVCRQIWYCDAARAAEALGVRDLQAESGHAGRRVALGTADAERLEAYEQEAMKP